MRKYLDDIGVIERPDTWNPTDKRESEWRQHRDVYGFDERELWDMRMSFYLWLYERLKWWLEFSPVNSDDYYVVYNDNEYTQRQLINMMIERLELYLKDEFYIEKNREHISEIEKMWVALIDSMWW